MSPREVAFGYLFGDVPSGPDEPPTESAPRYVLELVIRDSLEHAPCGVAFSGGRDSAAVLAVATHIARRDGLPLPVPITRVFPDAPASDESEWQEAVIRHLGLDEWQRVAMTDELDLVGPRAQEHLTSHGVLWPPMVHADGPLLDHLTGGSLIDGEGGDEVLGVEAHRIAPVTAFIRSPRSMTRGRLVAAATALAPGTLRARHMRREVTSWPITWLRPAAHRELMDLLGRSEAERPLSYATSVLRVPRRRTQAMMAHNRRILGRAHDVVISSPLTDKRFVASLAADGGRLGRGTRTTVLRSLVPDLLPDALLARATKATFDEAYLGRHTTEFAERWSGGGLDPDLVDAEELRRHWKSDERTGLTAALLQTAWLHDHRSANPSGQSRVH
jgi:asparagine synthetase B (glutamine-hydrolysing)